MGRSPFQVLIIPYLNNGDEILFALFQRGKEGYWQGIAGGGEDTETPLQAAKRESWEEAGISSERRFVSLDSLTTIPVEHVVGSFMWGEDKYVIPEYSFGVELHVQHLKLSHEHSQYLWVNYDEASKMLKWDSNKNAIWELNKRISNVSDKNGALT
ncbi:NUDIX hydrolase [Paenibacillus typhae]|uniref:dATP pyrophosphohydrolase n=1 Tax=Paenibacillus typhae TaxID=1174501 RepID=A0A1G8RVN6_9BACL|nr:NUDIX pyrophosphatase [Paenibacillus typhae]SDJ21009.1 dATP pyrophosphohydrolase [Paenibacillus typhae]